MAAITTAQAGNWDQTATWTGGVIPVSGDTVTLNHAVTVTDTRTVGHSPAAADATNAIRCNAALTIAGSGVLICRGDIGLNNVSLVLQAGAILEFDASAAGTPSTARYVCKGINSTDPAAILSITGTSGSRCTVRSNSGGANGRFTHNGNDNSGQVQAEYCDFIRIGDSSNPSFNFILGSGRFFLLTNCTFDSACGQIGDQADTGAYDGGARIELLNVTHRGGAGSNSVGIASVARSGSGTRRMEGCVWAKAVVLFTGGGWTISDTLFQSTYDVSGSAWATFLRNLIALPQAVIGDMAAHGDVTDCYLLRVGAPTNQHGFKSDDQTGDIDGCIFDMPDGTNGAGDCITFDNPSFSKTTFVRRCLVLPTESGVITGTLLSCLGGANQNVRAEHNTYLSGTSSAGIYVGESYAGHVGMLTACKSNLAWSPSANSALVIASESGIVQDVVLSANVTHNGKRNPANGGTGYDADLSFSSGTPGANDVTGDPQFVDATRNIKTWSTSLGGAGTVTDALTELAKKNDASGYDASYTIAALITYVREGFAPQNAAFDAGHDGDTIGAVPLSETVPDTYAHVRAITINSGMITGTLTDFPVLVAGTYAYLATVANGGLVQHASGHDVAFFSDLALTTQLKHEIEKWTAATGEVVYWVKVPSAAVGTVFYIAYGNASISTDQSDAVNVWDANFVGVWHLKDGTTLSALNSVTGGSGTINGPVAAAGSIDGAASFDGVDDNIDFGDTLDQTGAFTISCRCSTSDISIFLQMLVSKHNQSDATTFAYYLTLVNPVGADCFVRGFLSTDGTNANTKVTDGVTPVANDVWINPALVFSGVTTEALKVYLNGVDDSGTPSANATGTATNTTAKLVFGARQAGAGFARFFKGLLDEVRISNVARSTAWLAAEYNSQNDPGAFYTVGDEVGSGVDPFITLEFRAP